MILISFVIKHSQKYFRQQQEYLGHINGQVEEVYGGHLVIKAYNKEAETVKTFKEANNVALQIRLEIAVSLRTYDAYHAVCRKLRICGSSHLRWYTCP